MWQSRVDPLCSAIRNFSLHFAQFCIFILCIAFFKLQQLFGRTAMNGEKTAAAAAAFQFSFSAVCCSLHFFARSFICSFRSLEHRAPCRTIHSPSRPFVQLSVIVFEMLLNEKFHSIFKPTQRQSSSY